MLMKSRDDARQIVGANIQGFVDNVSVRLNRLDPLLHTLMSGIFLLSRCQCIPCSLISHGCAFFFFFFFFFFFWLLLPLLFLLLLSTASKPPDVFEFGRCDQAAGSD